MILLLRRHAACVEPTLSRNLCGCLTTRRRSRGRVDGVEATRHRGDHVTLKLIFYSETDLFTKFSLKVPFKVPVANSFASCL